MACQVMCVNPLRGEVMNTGHGDTLQLCIHTVSVVQNIVLIDIQEFLLYNNLRKVC